MGADVDEKVEIDEHLDFEIQCDVHDAETHWIFALIPVPVVGKRCERPAAWEGTCRACGTQFWLCDEHVKSIRPMCLVCGIQGKKHFDYRPMPKGRA